MSSKCSIVIFRLLGVLAIVSLPFSVAAGPQLGIGGPSENGVVSEEGSPSGPDAESPAITKSVATGLYMSGNFTYVLSGGVASITLSRIDNESFTRTTGTLRLTLWAVSYAPARAAGFTGYRLVTFTNLGQLPPRNYYSSIVRSGSYVTPPNGTYWLVLALGEYDPSACPGDSDGYCLVDSFVSNNQQSFGITLPTYDYSDLWWNANESGWGMAIVHHASNNVFVAWYTYDDFGNPKWYVAPTCQMNGDSCSSTLYQTRGPPFGPTFNPSAVIVQSVGSLSLSFSGRSTGTVSYNVNGSTGFKTITRQPF